VMHRAVSGTLVSADKDSKTLVLRTANGKDETFRLHNEAVIETGDGVITFAQFEPQAGAQITLHYDDPFGFAAVTRIKR
jgi:hypothetical protein